MAAPQQPRLSITCHCKAVRLTFPPLREPALECLCSICRRYGALWAYYKPDEVVVEGATEGYVWGKRTLSFNRCRACGCNDALLRGGRHEAAAGCQLQDDGEGRVG